MQIGSKLWRKAEIQLLYWFCVTIALMVGSVVWRVVIDLPQLTSLIPAGLGALALINMARIGYATWCAGKEALDVAESSTGEVSKERDGLRAEVHRMGGWLLMATAKMSAMRLELDGKEAQLASKDKLLAEAGNERADALRLVDKAEQGANAAQERATGYLQKLDQQERANMNLREQHEELDKEFEALGERHEKLDKDFKALKKRHEKLDEDFKALEKRHEAAVNSMNSASESFRQFSDGDLN